MMVAQQLYEGISLGPNGTQGLITYMRTDSTRISPVAQNDAAGFIVERFGSQYSKHGNRVKNATGAQDAHEAIRPSNVNHTPEAIAKFLDKDQLKLYTLIWNRFVASQMTAAVFDTVKVNLEQNGVLFVANGSQMKFDGYMAVYNDSDKSKMLPEMAEGEVVKKVTLTPEQHFTQPPARYSEASLIKTLEENGVGRPSTYAPTLDVIQRRYYVKLAAKRFEPTELGEIVNQLIVEFFPDIVDVKFTADMEDKLDQIEIGKEAWQNVIDQFYKPFVKELTKAETEIEKFKSRTSRLVLTVSCAATRWLLSWVDLASFMLVVIFLSAIIQRLLQRKLEFLVQFVSKARSSSAKQSVTVFSMAATATLSVTLPRGICGRTVLSEVRRLPC